MKVEIEIPEEEYNTLKTLFQTGSLGTNYIGIYYFGKLLFRIFGNK